LSRRSEKKPWLIVNNSAQQSSKKKESRREPLDEKKKKAAAKKKKKRVVQEKLRGILSTTKKKKRRDEQADLYNLPVLARKREKNSPAAAVRNEKGKCLNHHPMKGKKEHFRLDILARRLPIFSLRGKTFRFRKFFWGSKERNSSLDLFLEG